MIYTPAIRRGPFDLADLQQLTAAGALFLCLFALAPAFANNAASYPLAVLAVLLLVFALPAWPRPALLALPLIIAAMPGEWAMSRHVWMLLIPLAVASLERLDPWLFDRVLIWAGTGHAVAVLLNHDAAGRGIGYLANANLAAGMLAVLLLITLTSRWASTVCWANALLMAAALLMTRSVGGLLAALAGFAALLPWQLGAALLLTMFAGGVIALLIAGRGYWAERLDLWTVAAQVWRDSGGLGAGPGAFAAAWSNAYPAAYFAHSHAHNLILQVAAEVGIVGLAALVGLADWVQKNTWRRGQVLLIAVFVHGLVDCVLLYPLLLLVVAGAVMQDRLKIN